MTSSFKEQVIYGSDNLSPVLSVAQIVAGTPADLLVTVELLAKQPFLRFAYSATPSMVKARGRDRSYEIMRSKMESWAKEKMDGLGITEEFFSVMIENVEDDWSRRFSVMTNITPKTDMQVVVSRFHPEWSKLYREFPYRIGSPPPPRRHPLFSYDDFSTAPAPFGYGPFQKPVVRINSPRNERKVFLE